MVAVVVPSPATSEVFDATTLTSLAPMFSKGSLSSISFDTVTPSLVTVGPPNDLLRITLRPVGPSVVPTAWARISTPSSSFRRAASEKSSCLATGRSLLNMRALEDAGRKSRSPPIGATRDDPGPRSSLHDFRENVGLAEDLDLLAVHLDFRPRI